MVKNSITGLLVSLIVSIATNSSAQNTKDAELMVAFYNVENLFDTIDNPNTKDEEYTPEGFRKWGAERYQNKLNNLAIVIDSMNNGNAPDVLGLCEVENRKVVEDLVNTETLRKYNYQIVHEESKDWRGIDVALIYKEGIFTANKNFTYYVPMPDSISPTRDILVVQGTINEKPISFFVNHFPSRGGGLKKSQPKRIKAAKVLRHVIDSILEVNPMHNILCMGDFNDEPADSSMHHYLGARDFFAEEKRSRRLCNLMFRLKEEGKGSYKYRQNWNMLDQIIVSEHLADGLNGLGIVPQSVGIYAQDWMKQKTPRYFGSPLRTFGGRKYLAGYSDHFPVFIKLKVVNGEGK